MEYGKAMQVARSPVWGIALKSSVSAILDYIYRVEYDLDDMSMIFKNGKMIFIFIIRFKYFNHFNHFNNLCELCT